MVENKPANKLQPKSEDSIDSFDTFGFKPDLLKGIYTHLAHSSDKNPLRPYPVQSRSIVPMITGKNVVVQAPYGRGKTTTIVISMLQLIDTESPNFQALILTPTRELARNTEDLIRSLGEYLKISVYTVQGGIHKKEDEKKLQEGVQVIVGTPGRIYDMLARGLIKAEHLKLFILDETDEILGRGFMDHIKDTFNIIPNGIQTAFFSETTPPENLELAKNFMKDPIQIKVLEENPTMPNGIKHFYTLVDNEEQKFEALVKLYESIDTQQIVIYCNTKNKAEELTIKLKEKNLTVSCLHEGLNQMQNELNLKDFRTGAAMILVTTDLVSQNFGIPSIRAKIYYEQSTSEETYVRRIGISGKFACKYIIVNIVMPPDYELLEKIEKFYNTQVDKMPPEISSIFDW